jgi:hypothetical protein
VQVSVRVSMQVSVCENERVRVSLPKCTETSTKKFMLQIADSKIKN